MTDSFKNLFHVLRRFRVASILNLFGLSIAFTAFLIVMMYVRFEYGYDRFHENRSRIFQIEIQRDDKVWENNFSRPIFEAIATSSPHIKSSGAYMGIANIQITFVVSANKNADESGYAEKIERITPGFTDVFNFPMIDGSVDALRKPDHVLIPESMAQKFFGNENCIGKPLYLVETQALGNTFNINGTSINSTQTIGGVFKDFPENSRLKNVIYFPIAGKEMMHDWNTGPYHGYVLLDSEMSTTEIAENFKSVNSERLAGLMINDIRFRPLEELYFGEKVRSDSSPAGNKKVTDILILIAFLVVIIASVNFINFSIALTPVRIKNINTRKVLGSSTVSLRQSLVSESILITMLAFLLALMFTAIIQDSELLNGLLGFDFSLLSNLQLVALTGCVALLTGVAAGLYPAWYMTSFPVSMVLNGSFAASGQTRFIRKALLGFQYVISILLIVCALFINIQNRYIQTVDMGFDKENILAVKLSQGIAATQSDLYRQKLKENTHIQDVAFCQVPFVSDGSKPFIAYYFKEERHYQYWLEVSHNFAEVMGLELQEGRSFQQSDVLRQDDEAVCIVNETAAKDMGATAGENLYDNNQPIRIVGVFKDLHFESLYSPIKPLGLWVSAKGHYRSTTPVVYSYIRITPEKPKEAIDHIRKTLEEIDPAFPAEINFLDQTINALYSRSEEQGLMVTLFSVLAVFLSIVGVFGLVIFEAQGRIKEIAVRKVMGATVREILTMLNTGFVKIVLICFTVAAPLAWYGVDIWLENFSYKTPIHIWVFFLALLMVLILTVLTVSFQSYRAATMNPVQAIRSNA